jgi:hypothetical protein
VDTGEQQKSKRKEESNSGDEIGHTTGRCLETVSSTIPSGGHRDQFPLYGLFPNVILFSRYIEVVRVVLVVFRESEIAGRG